MNGFLLSLESLSPNSLFSGTKKLVPPNAATLLAYEFVIQFSISISINNYLLLLIVILP